MWCDTNALLACRKKGERRDAAPPINQLPPPPLPPEPDMLFAEQPDISAVFSRLASADGQPPAPPRGQPRIGRGGRLIFDRSVNHRNTQGDSKSNPAH